MTADRLHIEIDALLRRCRLRRMTLRAVESAGMCAAACWLAASWTLLGRWAWRDTPAAEAAWALMGLVVTWGVGRALGRTNQTRIRAGSTAWLLAGGVCVVWAVLTLTGVAEAVGAWPWAAGCGLAGAIIGAAAAAVLARDVEGTAREVDGNLGLRGRLITAWQVAGSGDASPAGLCVCRQARDRVGARTRRRCVLWRQGRGLVAMLVASCVVSAACAALATPEPAPEGFAQRLASSLDRLSTAQRQQLARKLRQRGFDRPDAQRDVMRRAARALEQRDAKALTELAEALEAADVDLEAIASEDVRTAVGAGRGQGQIEDPPNLSPREADPRISAGGDVLVYHDGYGDGADRGRPEIEDEGPAVGRYTSPAGAWDAARREALGALSAGRVPPRHEDWVRRYFQDME